MLISLGNECSKNMQRNKLKLIGMNMNPPFFLPLTIKENIDEEQDRRIRTKKNMKWDITDKHGHVGSLHGTLEKMMNIRGAHEAKGTCYTRMCNIFNFGGDYRATI